VRLLLIEDDPMIGDAVADALRGDGHGVDWAQDGAAGLPRSRCRRRLTGSRRLAARCADRVTGRVRWQGSACKPSERPT
jgi:CheY-like chemotaxis protein